MNGRPSLVASSMVPAALVVTLLAGHAVPDERADNAVALRTAESFASIDNPRQRSIALFEEAGKVIQHPRCVNCHPVTDSPLQTDLGHVHTPPVTRGADGLGASAMHCTTCHQADNVDLVDRSIPGHPKWHLAPAEMAWEGKSLGEICAQIKDPDRNGGHDLDFIVEHMASDSLVGWGWHPGKGRTPAPGSQQALGELIRAWVDSGAHCPGG